MPEQTLRHPFYDTIGAIEVVQHVNVVEVAFPGPRGPRGDQGVPGGSLEFHEIAFVNATEVRIQHLLLRKIFISVFHADNHRMFTEEDQSVSGLAVIRFTSPTTGSILWL